MTHYWGDDWLYWDDLYEAQQFIEDKMENRNLRVVMKEKYGSLRYEHVFEIYRSNSGGDDARDWRVLYAVMQEAIGRWPHLEDEILSDFAANEEIVGKEIHDRYWIKVTGNKDDK